MANRFKTWNDFHHQINQIYHLFIAISLIPFALLFLEIDSEKRFSIDNSFFSSFLIFLMSVGVVFLSWYTWKGKKSQYILVEDMSLRDKLMEYRKKSIWRFTLLLVAGLIALTGLWLTSNYLFVITYFAVLVQYSFLRPSQDRAINDLRLTKAERKMFLGGDVA